MAAKRVLVINLGWEQAPLLAALHARGYELFGVHNEAPPAELSFKKLKICDFRDLPAILDFAHEVAPSMVVSDQCDYSMFAQAVVAETMGLPGPSIANAQVATNKLIQRQACKNAGLLIPEFRAVNCPADALEAARSIGYPVIIKPVDNRGSFGVGRADEDSEVAARYIDALVNSHSRIVLVEKFIEGVHITVDGYAFPRSGVRSLTCASKQLLGGGRQVAMDIVYPAELPAAVRERAMRVNEQVNEALGLSFGMLHSEYMVTGSGDVYLIETANRGGGCFTSELIVPENSGIDVVNQLIDDCAGIDEDRYAPPRHAGVLLKFFRFRQGKVVAVRGLEAAAADPGVVALRVTAVPGSSIRDITTDGNRHGFVIVRGSGNLRERAEGIMKKVEVDYE